MLVNPTDVVLNMRNPDCRRGPVLAAAALCCLLGSGTVAAEDYACHVLTEGEQAAVLLVDTQGKADASRMAAHAKVRVKGTPSPVIRVVQCILRNSERFASPDAQRLLDAMEL